ncbi:MAG TPA: pseudouridine synthase [Candidatus Babeliales bacterium]|nr:pseudouridine synthase [Candidatus Babeliales bacterium]
MQLNKFLAHSGVSSRRNAVELIKQGLVKVNGEVVKEPGRVLLETDTVTVQGKKIEVERKLYIILNKPRGYITTTSDEQGRDTVMDLIGSSYKERLYPVGRLDRNTTGILLLTNDGELAQRLAHPKHQIQKVYHVTVNKPFTEVDRKRILTGVRLSDGKVTVDRISHALGPKKNQLRITIHSGKYRVVRRLFEAVGYEVKKLDRVQYANMNKRGLPAGVWRKLQQKEVNYLKKAVGLE